MVFQDRNPGTRDAHSLQRLFFAVLFTGQNWEKYTLFHTNIYTLIKIQYFVSSC